ncbi:MAG: hypothetical protein HY321_00455, partial [Armatimonadetes bacterium]|nr:hypothetical protein [Armatimonadota bacterium]
MADRAGLDWAVTESSAAPGGASVEAGEAVPTKGRVRPLAILGAGAALTALNAIWMTYTEIAWNRGFPTILSLQYNMVFALALLTPANALLRRKLPALALRRGELLLLFLMGTVGNGTAIMAEYLVAILPYPYHFASTDLRWSEDLLPELPKLLTVSDPDAVRAFYAGNADLWRWAALRPWLPPFLAWGLLLAGVVCIAISLSALVYGQVRYQERLPFPLIQIPLAMTGERVGFYRAPLFWIGFTLAAGVDVVNQLHMINPTIPELTVKRSAIRLTGLERPWVALNPIFYSINPFLIGLEFLMPLDLLWSVFFFYWVARFQGVVIELLMGEQRVPAGDMVAAFAREQAVGALLALLFFSFWTMRGRWRESWRKYRPLVPIARAGMGAAAGTAAILAVLCLAGMSLPLAAFFVAVYIGVTLSLARIRAQYGPPAAGLLLAAPGPVLYSILGHDGLGARGLSSLSLTHWLGRELCGSPQPATLEGFALLEGRCSPRLTIAGIALGAMVGYAAAFGTILVTAYSQGMSTGKVAGVEAWFGWEAYKPFSSRMMDAVSGPHLDSLMAMGAGAAATLLLQALRTRLVSFPLHPVGYAISSTWVSSFLWSTAIITWTIKSLVLRYGGLRGYYRVAPFFWGLLLGEFL